MSVGEYFDFMAPIVLWSMFCLAIPMPLSWFLITILYPDNLKERYLVQPQFSRTECIVFRHYPASMTFSAMTMWIFCFPSWGRKRKMTDIREQAPGWFKCLLSFMAVMVFLSVLLVIALLTTWGIAELYLPDPT